MKIIKILVKKCAGCLYAVLELDIVKKNDRYVCSLNDYNEWCPATGIPEWCPLPDVTDPADNPESSQNTAELTQAPAESESPGASCKGAGTEVLG